MPKEPTRDIEVVKKTSWRNLFSHLKEVGQSAKLFRILKNSRRLANHNLRRPDGFYKAGPSEALECLLDSVCPTGGQDSPLPRASLESIS